MAGWIFQCFLLINYYLAYNRGYHYNRRSDSVEEDSDYELNPYSEIDYSYLDENIPKPEELARSGADVTMKKQDNVKNTLHSAVDEDDDHVTGYDDDDYILTLGPTDDDHPPPTRIPLNLPEECERMGICDNVPDYPQEIVDRMLSQNGNTRSVRQINMAPVDISKRNATADEEEIKLCTSVETEIYPKAIRNRTGRWYYIMSQYDFPIHSLKVEICDTNNTACSDHANSTPGYEASCKQQYEYRRMTVLGAQDVAITDSFPVPSYCSCTLMRTTSKK